MRVTARTGGITHDAGRARDLVAHPVQHALVHTRQRGGRPRGPGGVLDDPCSEIVVEVHSDILGDTTTTGGGAGNKSTPVPL